MMYVVYNINRIHHLLNESKKSKFVYNSHQMEEKFNFKNCVFNVLKV